MTVQRQDSFVRTAVANGTSNQTPVATLYEDTANLAPDSTSIASAKIVVTTPTNPVINNTDSAPTYGADLIQSGFATANSTTYTIVFWAKCADPKGARINAALQQNQGSYLSLFSQDITLTPTWALYMVVGSSGANGAANTKVQFTLGSKADAIWIDEVAVYTGDVSCLLRQFQGGCVVANMSGSSQTVTLPGTYRKFAGTQDATTNNGATGLTTVTVPSGDGLLLRV